MKKSIACILCALVCASCLTACGNSAEPQPQNVRIAPPPVSDSQTEPDRDISNDTDEQQKRKPIQPRAEIEITIDGREADGIRDFVRPDLRGVRRFFENTLEGVYTVEYIHAPYGVDRDETLDYRIEINSDNTFSMTVVSEGVKADHTGRWYARRESITFFYDEQIDPPAHNVYVADSMYAEILPHGKLMIYDNCHTLVLSKTDLATPYQSQKNQSA